MAAERQRWMPACYGRYWASCFQGKGRYVNYTLPFVTCLPYILGKSPTDPQWNHHDPPRDS